MAKVLILLGSKSDIPVMEDSVKYLNWFGIESEMVVAHSLMLREVTGSGAEVEGTGDLGRSWLLFALLVTFAVDTGAYLVGRASAAVPPR